MSGESARRARLLLAIPALLLVAAIAADIYLLLGAGTSPSRMVLVLVIQGVVLITAIALFWTWLETRVLHPLRTLEDDIDLIVHGNPHHSPEPPAGHGLGTLPDAVNRLAIELSRWRLDTGKAMDSARAQSERRGARLEAILGDLSEAVIVCTRQHRIVLYNGAASRLLDADGKLGVGRVLTAVLQPAALRGALAELLNRQARGEDARGTATCTCHFAENDREPLPGRMRLVIEQDGSASGYVLVFGGGGELPASEPAGGLKVDLLERPVYYDFDLFEKDLDRDLLAMPLADLHLVVFDTETTGLEPSRGDEIVQIAGVRVLNGRVLEEDRFDELVNPGMPIPRASTRIHGISDDMVAGREPARDVLPRFHAFVGDAVLVAHNAAFDMKFLKLKEPEIGVRFDHAVLDTLLLSVVLQPGHTAHTLDAIANRFGIENRDRHSALGDSITTALVFVSMIRVLEARGIRTLGDALEASDRVFEVKRLQERF